MKSLIKKFFSYFFLLFPIVTLVIMELTLSLFYDLANLQQRSGVNSSCDKKSFYPHPQLGYTFETNSKCETKVNSIVSIENDLPWVKEDDYIILLLGSDFTLIASQWINDYVKSTYLPPQGKSFKIINAATTGWKQPIQLIQLMKSIGRFDAFLSFEGQEEASIIERGFHLDMPSEEYFKINDFLDLPKEKPLIEKIRKVMANSWLKKSYILNLLIIYLEKNNNKPHASHLKEPLAVKHFQYPDHWDFPRRKLDSIEQYTFYLGFIDSLSVAHGFNGLVALQPLSPKPVLTSNIYNELDERIKFLKTNKIKIISLIHLRPETSAVKVAIDELAATLKFKLR